MNKAKDKSEGKAKGGSMVGRIIWEVLKILITAFIILCVLKLPCTI